LERKAEEVEEEDGNDDAFVPAREHQSKSEGEMAKDEEGLTDDDEEGCCC